MNAPTARSKFWGEYLTVYTGVLFVEKTCNWGLLVLLVDDIGGLLLKPSLEGVTSLHIDRSGVACRAAIGQTRTVLSPPPVASALPSALNVMEWTGRLLWPRNTSIWLLLPMSHIRIPPSSQPVAAMRPSGLTWLVETRFCVCGGGNVRLEIHPPLDHGHSGLAIIIRAGSSSKVYYHMLKSR